jgi:hypothetical protein
LRDKTHAWSKRTSIKHDYHKTLVEYIKQQNIQMVEYIKQQNIQRVCTTREMKETERHPFSKKKSKNKIITRQKK